MAKTVVCKSGIKGWQCKLQTNYSNLEEFQGYCEIYNLHGRLGYKTPEAAWQKNPVVQGSVIPSDFRKVRVKK